jgi:uncharacterized repeat protein (TIGR03803 family)
MQTSRAGFFALFNLVVCVCCGLHAVVAQAQHHTLFSFRAPDGARPSALVRGNDGLLYGTAREGGAHGKGTVFMLSADGRPQVLYSFTGQADGAGPSQLVSSGDQLYGLSSRTVLVESPASVNVFRLDHSGAFQVLQTIPGNAASVALAAGENGGVYGSNAASSTLFAIDAAGVLRTIHAFSAGIWANALVAGTRGRVYGTTLSSAGAGTGQSELFRATSAGEYRTLAQFGKSAQSGTAETPTTIARDRAGLLYAGVRTDSRGAVYSFRSAAPLKKLSDLDAAPTLLLSGETDQVHGLTADGGAMHHGSVFRLGADGSLSTLHEFGAGADGEVPTGLTLDGDSLSGTAAEGGIGSGSIFRLSPTQAFSTLFSFTYPSGIGPTSVVRGADGTLYGTTQDGGPKGAGTVFKSDVSGHLETLYAFAGPDGSAPTSLTYGSDGKLYGRTLSGGNEDDGTLFRLATSGEFAVLVHFNEPREGAGPALLQTSDGTLYGADQAGSGHIFRVAASNELETIYTFPGLQTRDGANPSGLVDAGNGLFYGTTLGAYGPLIPPNYSSGTIFRVGTDGTFTTLYSFNDDHNALGASPRSLILGSDGKLYGTTSNLTFVCGTFGGLWDLELTSNHIEQFYAFTGKQDGTGPLGLVEPASHVFYGLTVGGVGPREASSAGGDTCGVRNSTLFRHSDKGLVTLESLPFVIAASVNSADLGRAASLIDGKDQKLYGTIANGGVAGAGELFAYDLTATSAK